MMLARNVTSRGARGAAILALLLASAAPVSAAQSAGATAAPATATAPAAAPDPQAPPAQAPAPVGPQPMSESVAAVVNDDIISTYDLGQRMRLLIATSGVQPTRRPCPSSSARRWSRWSTSGCSCRS